MPKIFVRDKWERIKFIQRDDAVEAKSVDTKTGTSMGDQWDVTFDDIGLVAIHKPKKKKYRVRLIVGLPMAFHNQAYNVTVAPSGQTPDVVVVTPTLEGKDIIIPLMFQVNVTGVNTTAGETITLEIDIVLDNGKIVTITRTYTADTTTPDIIPMEEVVKVIPHGRIPIGVQLMATSDQSSTNASVTVIVHGLEF